MIFQKANRLQGEITVPGDKSISHRGVMFGALSEGTTRLTHFLQGADCLSTISCFEKMGIPIENNGNEILVHVTTWMNLENIMLREISKNIITCIYKFST